MYFIDLGELFKLQKQLFLAVIDSRRYLRGRTWNPVRKPRNRFFEPWKPEPQSARTSVFAVLPPASNYVSCISPNRNTKSDGILGDTLNAHCLGEKNS